VCFIPENAGDEQDKLTSVAMKEKCSFVAGYKLESYIYQNGKGKNVRGQRKTNLASILNPEPSGDDGGGGNGG
jgi:hypothetical protein